MSPVVVGSLLFGADELVGEMVRSRIAHMRTLQWGSFQALGVVRRGQLVGGVVYHHYRGFDIQIAAAFDAKGWALPGTLRALCAYPFAQLGVTRVTAITGKKNKKARRTLERIGFVLEGVAKRGLDGVEDAMIFGLLRDNCKWLKDKDHGIRIETTTCARPV